MPALPATGERAACCPSVGRPRKGHQLELLRHGTQLDCGGEMQWEGGRAASSIVHDAGSRSVFRVG